MADLPVPWWAFWLVAALALYLGLIWYFVREATRRPPLSPAQRHPGPEHESVQAVPGPDRQSEQESRG